MSECGLLAPVHRAQCSRVPYGGIVCTVSTVDISTVDISTATILRLQLNFLQRIIVPAAGIFFISYLPDCTHGIGNACVRCRQTGPGIAR